MTQPRPPPDGTVALLSIRLRSSFGPRSRNPPFDFSPYRSKMLRSVNFYRKFFPQSQMPSRFSPSQTSGGPFANTPATPSQPILQVKAKKTLFFFFFFSGVRTALARRRSRFDPRRPFHSGPQQCTHPHHDRQPCMGLKSPFRALSTDTADPDISDFVSSSFCKDFFQQQAVVFVLPASFHHHGRLGFPISPRTVFLCRTFNPA